MIQARDDGGSPVSRVVEVSEMFCSVLRWNVTWMSFLLIRKSRFTVSVHPFKSLRTFSDLYPVLDTEGVTMDKIGPCSV